MSLVSSRRLAIQKPRSLRRFSLALVCGCSSLALVAGCQNKEETAPVSKFEVADDSATSKTTASPVTTSPSNAPGASNDSVAGTPTADPSNAASPVPGSSVAGTPGGSAPKSDPAMPAVKSPGAGDVSASPPATNPGATPPPSFSPTVTQGADTRSFMSLVKPETADAKGWMEFLAKTDIAMRDLMMAIQSQQIAEPQFMERANYIDKLKLEASEALLSQAQTPEERDAGLLGKLQALSQMAGLNDAKAADDLRAFASEISKIENPDAAHQANVVMAMFYLADYKTGKTKDVQPILDQMDKAWADKKYVSMPDLRMASEILAAFQGSGDMTAFDSARAKTIAALGDSDNLQVAGTVWQLQVMNSKEFANLRQELEAMMSGSAEVPVDRFKTVLDEFAKVYSSQMTYAFIAKQSIDVEYAGLLDHARVMNEMVKGGKDQIKNPQMKADIERSIEDFEKRAAILGKPIALDGLKTMDGQPLDWSKFKGKVVLVDIWATWCGPCIGEFPNMKSIYTQFKDKGFEIVGVSVDEEAAELQAFMQKDPLPWTVAISSDPAKIGFETPVAKDLGVTAIPFLVLVDRAGNVVGMHKRGKALEQAVAELVQQ
jgi:thiol-disulfide isomerase/thioredoxin